MRLGYFGGGGRTFALWLSQQLGYPYPIQSAWFESCVLSAFDPVSSYCAPWEAADANLSTWVPARLSSWLLTVAQCSPGVAGIWGACQWVGDLSFCFSDKKKNKEMHFSINSFIKTKKSKCGNWKIPAVTVGVSQFLLGLPSAQSLVVRITGERGHCQLWLSHTPGRARGHCDCPANCGWWASNTLVKGLSAVGITQQSQPLYPFSDTFHLSFCFYFSVVSTGNFFSFFLKCCCFLNIGVPLTSVLVFFLCYTLDHLT